MGNINKKQVRKTTGSISVSIFVFALFLVAYFFYRFKMFPALSDQLQQGLGKHIKTICVVWVAYVIQRIVGAILNWYGEKVVSRTETELDDKLVPLFSRIARVIVWLFAVIIILPLYGVHLSAVIATLGVGSLAIALAAQDTVANMISGFLIMVDTPFRIGDRIKLPSGENVKVMNVGIRRSTFLSEDKKTVIIVPNVDLCKSKIVNYSYAEGLEAKGKLKDNESP